MNQIAASILVLSASVCGVGAAVRSHDQVGGALGLVAIGLALWGGMALWSATINPKFELFDEDDGQQPDEESRSARARGMSRAWHEPSRHDHGGDAGGYRLTPETSAQLSLVAQLKGKNRADLVEDILRHNLPRYTSGSRAG